MSSQTNAPAVEVQFEIAMSNRLLFPLGMRAMSSLPSRGDKFTAAKKFRYLLLFVGEERPQEIAHLGRLQRVWPVTLYALIGTRALPTGRQHQLHRLPALRTNSLVHGHQDHPAKGALF